VSSASFDKDIGAKNTNSLASNIFDELILIGMKQNFLVLVLLVNALFGCRKDTKIDVIKPEVTSLTINGLNSTVFEIEAGDTLDVGVGLFDNEAIDEMHMDIHDAEDGHTHIGSGHSGGEFHLNSGEWEVHNVKQFGGSTTVQNEFLQVIVPDTIAGNWHLVITARDRVGNESDEYTALIRVVNPNFPSITGTTVPAADVTGTIYLATGATLFLSGIVEDADGLAEINTYLMTYSSITGEITPIVMEGSNTIWSFEGVSFDNAQPGTYRVVIEAKDLLGHRRYWDRRVIVQ